MVPIFFLFFTNALNITFFILLLVLIEPLLKKYFAAVCIYRFWVVLLIGLLIPMRFDTSKALLYINLPNISIEYNSSDDLGMQESKEFYNSTSKDTLSQKQLTLDTRDTNISLKESCTLFLKYFFQAISHS